MKNIILVSGARSFGKRMISRRWKMVHFSFIHLAHQVQLQT